MRLAEITEQACVAPEAPVGAPAPEAIRTQLERLRTKAFAGSDKLFSFLRFVVEEALEGRAATLKELVIGIELYGGVVDYDPRIDSAVRVEARRLRRKLDAYYAGPGRHDPVIVSMPTGSYAPCFCLRQGGDPLMAGSPRAAAARMPMLAILPFTALSVEQSAFAAGVTDELISAAERGAKVRVTPRAIMFQFRDARYSLEDVVTQAGSDLVLHGTVREAHDIRRVTMELYNRWGQTLWSDRVDLTGGGDLDAQERLAVEIVSRLPATALRDVAVAETV